MDDDLQDVAELLGKTIEEWAGWGGVVWSLLGSSQDGVRRRRRRLWPVDGGGLM